jgi:L-threonylcarbamoyladenylate synthase
VIDAAVAAIEAGEPVIIPTDTVYGLATNPEREEAVARLYRVKGRAARQPTALVAADLEALFERIPELRESPAVRALLPGPFTLVLPNAAGRYPWLAGERPDAIGVRVPALTGPGREVLDRVRAVVATSANLPGGRDPRTVDDVPPEIRDRCAAVVDGGELPGVASTVVDLTATEPRVLREGAVPAAEVVERVRAAAAN